jgi:hypothetical protein
VECGCVASFAWVRNTNACVVRLYVGRGARISGGIRARVFRTDVCLRRAVCVCRCPQVIVADAEMEHWKRKPAPAVDPGQGL